MQLLTKTFYNPRKNLTFLAETDARRIQKLRLKIFRCPPAASFRIFHFNDLKEMLKILNFLRY